MILVHLAKGFEEIEAITIVDILRRAQLDAHFVSTTGETLVVGAHGIAIDANYLFEDINYKYCQMIVLPGGLEGSNGLKDHKGLCNELLKFASENKGIAAICAAPMVLGELGIVDGRKATIYPGMEDKLNGAKHVSDNVVRDGNIITSKGPATAMEFALAIVEFFKGKEASQELSRGLLMR